MSFWYWLLLEGVHRVVEKVFQLLCEDDGRILNLYVLIAPVADDVEIKVGGLISFKLLVVGLLTKHSEFCHINMMVLNPLSVTRSISSQNRPFKIEEKITKFNQNQRKAKPCHSYVFVISVDQDLQKLARVVVLS